MMMRKMKNVMKMATESKKVGQKRKAKSAIVDNRKLKRQKMYKFSKYYKGSYYGKSASFVFYQLVT